jgi:hypothetical protein
VGGGYGVFSDIVGIRKVSCIVILIRGKRRYVCLCVLCVALYSGIA